MLKKTHKPHKAHQSHHKNHKETKKTLRRQGKPNINDTTAQSKTRDDFGNNKFSKTYSNNSINLDNELVVQKNFYNPRNKLITREYIEGLLERVTGLPVKIKTLYPYQLAFVHKSVHKRNIAPPGEPEVVFYQTYESLEFVGDAWVGAIVADYLYHRFSGQDEGFLTKLRTKIVCSKQMAKYSEYLGLSEYVIITPRIEKAIGRNHVKIMEDIFEALCAAIKQDLGIPILEIFVKNLIEATANFTNIILFDDDYKTMLLQYFQKHGWAHPTYSTISHDGPGHKRLYTMGLDYLPDFEKFDLPAITVKDTDKNGNAVVSKYLTTAKAKAKKEAEQLASKEALIMFGVVDA